MPVAAAKQALFSHLDGLRQSQLWLAGQSGVIAAVSGGPDSMALALVAAEVCRDVSVRFEAVVIDHGLRDGSAAEAQAVSGYLEKRGIPARLFTVPGPAPKAGKQAWAREQRFQLLCDYARQTSSAVLFAHHRDDQAETVMMRLAHGSGVAGLAAIAPVSVFQGVVFGRPFLGLAKADLIAVCQACDAWFVTDPSNSDPSFERVRARQWLQSTDAAETYQHIMRLSALSSALSSRLRREVSRWCAANSCFTQRLRAELDKAAFAELSYDAQKHILRHCLAVVGAQPYPVSEEALDRLADRLAAGQISTASGCVVEQKEAVVTLTAEFGRPPSPEKLVRAGRLCSFDKRWLIFAPKDGYIRRLGAQGWAARDKADPAFQAVSGWPARMGAMIPVLDGLDGKRYHPHFKPYQAVCSAARQGQADIGAKMKTSSREEVFVCSLAADGPLDAG